MRSTLVPALTVAALLASFAVARASTEVSGEQSGTWTAAGSPYVVTRDVTVAAGDTLVIEANAVVKFARYRRLTVSGHLEARGAPEQMIFLTALTDDLQGDTNGDGTNTVPEAGYWNRIEFADGSSGLLSYCQIAYAGYYEDSGRVAVRVSGDAAPAITGCLIHDVSGEGVRVLDTAAPTITACEIHGDSEYGIEVRDQARPSVGGNRITGCEWPLYVESIACLPAVTADEVFVDNEHHGVFLSEPGGDDTIASGDDVTLPDFGGIPYFLNRNLLVEAGATLRIPAGLILKLARYRQITVAGDLQAVGTAGAPIVFTAATDDLAGDTDDGDFEPEIGYWNRIEFVDGSSGTLEHCRIQYAGYYENGGRVGVLIGDDAAPAIRHCRVDSIQGDGIRVTGTARPIITDCDITQVGDNAFELLDQASPALVGNRISGCAWPVYLESSAALPSAASANEYSACEYYGAYLGALTADATIPAGADVTWLDLSGLPYYLPYGMTVEAGATLRIPAGTIVKMRQYRVLLVNGTLLAIGAEDEPIIFTAASDDLGGDTNGDGDAHSPATGYWNRIEFADGSSGRLEHCRLKYAGYYENSGMVGLVIGGDAAPAISRCQVDTTTGDGIRIGGTARPSITDCLIRAASRDGIRLQDAASPILLRNIITGARWPVAILSGTAMADTVGGNSYPDNEYHGLRHEAPNVAAGDTVIWRDFGLPYLLDREAEVAAGGKLTLPAGLIVKLKRYRSVTVRGDLRAEGAPGAPVIFTADTDDVGGDTNGDGQSTDAGPADYWNRIEFADGSTGVLDYCQIKYAGYYYNGGNTAILCRGSAAPAITRCDLHYIDGDGIRADDHAAPTIHRCLFGNDLSYAVRNAGDGQVNAQENWWGAASGPYHGTLNPDGEGRPVTDGVDFSLFLESLPVWEDRQLLLVVTARVGYRSTETPLRTQVGRRVAFEVMGYTLPDSSDLHEVVGYAWDVPEELGTVLEPGVLQLTSVADVVASIVFSAGGAGSSFLVISEAGSIEEVRVEPAVLTVAPGGQQTFRATAVDEYGNVLAGRSFGWHAVGDIGTINSRTGAFTAAATPGEGYVIAVVSRALVFGDAGTTVEGSARVTVGQTLPTAYALRPNYPNPFNPETVIRFDLPLAGPVRLRVFDVLGRQVAELVDGPLPAGVHQVRWDGTGQASGVYLYRLESGPFMAQRRMLLLR